jgi:hypothetical protein
VETHQVGVNTVYVDGDLVHTVCNGETTLAMVQEYFPLVERVLAEKGRVFLLADASKTIAISSEARRYITEWSKTHRLTAVANVVTSPVARAMMTMVTRAMNLLGQPSPRTVFVSTLAEAQAFVAAQREDYFRHHPNAPR